MPTPGFVKEPDWNGSETTFQGAPRWISQAKYDLMKRLTALSSQAIVPYGQEAEQQAELASLKKQLEGIDKIEADYERKTQIPFSITGTSEPVAFTPAQLQKAATNPQFAAQLFAQGAGITPLPGDVAQFQSRIKTEIPDLPQRVQHQHEVARAERQKLDAENAQEKSRYNNETTAFHSKLAEHNTIKGIAPKLKQLADDRASFEADATPDTIDRYHATSNSLGLQLHEIKKKYPNNNFLSNFKLHTPSANNAEGIRNLHKNLLDYIENTNKELKLSSPRAANIKQWQPEDTDETLLNRAQYPVKMDEINDQFGRIAPLPALREAAERLMQRSVGNERSSFSLANSEIQNATGRDISGDTQRYVDKATVPTHEQLDPYMNKYNKDVIDSLREEAKKNFLEEVMPNITGNFASAGAFHSGARENQIRKFAERTSDTLNRDIAKLLHQGHSEAHTRAGEHNDRHMSAAQVMGQAQKAHQEGDLRTAEAARHQGLANKQASALDATALDQFGELRQKHRQNQINDKMNLHQEHQLEPMRRLMTESHVMASHPVTDQMIVTSKPQAQPTPPNAANVFGGILGQMADVRQQQHSFKKGGSVKNKYAHGGVVQRFNEMENQIQPQKYEQQSAEIGNELRNYRVDPMQNWLQHVSAQMLANNRGDPLANMGKGAQVAEEHMNHHRDRMIDSRAKAGNLYDAINRSRSAQQELLANFADKEAVRGETRRHHGQVEAYNNAKLQQKMNAQPSEKDQLDLEYKRARIDELRGKSTPQEIAIGDRTIKPKMKVGLTPADAKELKENADALAKYKEKLGPYESMKRFISQSKAKGEEPRTGYFTSMLPNWSERSRALERELKDMVSSEFPAGVVTTPKLKFAEARKPTDADSLETIEGFADNRIKTAKANMVPMEFIESMGAYNIPKRISLLAYKQWHEDGEQGDPTDYVKAILEGEQVSPSERAAPEASSSIQQASSQDIINRIKQAVGQ